MSITESNTRNLNLDHSLGSKSKIKGVDILPNSYKELVDETRSGVWLENLMLPLDQFRRWGHLESVYRWGGSSVSSWILVSHILHETLSIRSLPSCDPTEETYQPLCSGNSFSISEGPSGRLFCSLSSLSDVVPISGPRSHNLLNTGLPDTNTLHYSGLVLYSHLSVRVRFIQSVPTLLRSPSK